MDDYRNVDPRLGTMDDFDAMVEAAHAVGIKVVVDIVPNHSSNRHEYFKAALAAGKGSPERDRYIFRDGRGETANYLHTIGNPFLAALHGRALKTVSGICTCSLLSSQTGTG